jgi:hypothetical protein
MQTLRTISELARERGIPPRKISDLFYSRKLDDSLCPLIGGRRLIPLEYVPLLDAVLQQAGVLGGEVPHDE